jgi:hypothetical protein
MIQKNGKMAMKSNVTQQYSLLIKDLQHLQGHANHNLGRLKTDEAVSFQQDLMAIIAHVEETLPMVQDKTDWAKLEKLALEAKALQQAEATSGPREKSLMPADPAKWSREWETILRTTLKAL